MPLKEFTSTIFSGRSSELDVLQRIASQAASGDASSVILSGKRGIGKTELLKHLFNKLFNDQKDTTPFFYTIKTAFTSVNSFSKDYFCNFILQYLAFQGKAPSLINASIYSPEDLRDIANKSGAQWAVDIIDDYLQIREGGDMLKLFSFVISAPYKSYLNTGIPVVVIIDDFHKIRKLSELNSGNESKEIWTLFENSIDFRYTPHILAGLRAELRKMFFEETSIGVRLEILNLEGLSRHDSIELFRYLCEKYALSCEAEFSGFIGLFGGNPFYIKTIVQAARQSVKTITDDNFWEIYIREITEGKIYTYWTSILKAYIRRFDLIKPSLKFFYHLWSNSVDDVLANPSEKISLQREELDNIIELLHRSDTIEMGFSTIELSCDEIFNDVIKGLYYREIQKEPLDRIKDLIAGDRRRCIKLAEAPSFNITIPSTPKAELVAVKSLEHIAQYFNIPLETTGKLQVALVELFSGVHAKNGSSAKSYQVKCSLRENIFSMEVITSQRDFVMTDEDSIHIRSYFDDIRFESIMNGTRIILVKKLKENFAAA
ncbi:MAG TPA: ATP-binding protein [Nitrospirae bacterium]|nr:ATP-binding protein [Nitrospirota bacterium]